eukprot:6158988-Alexandrium_andersonii.AAC.1
MIADESVQWNPNCRRQSAERGGTNLRMTSVGCGGIGSGGCGLQITDCGETRSANCKLRRLVVCRLRWPVGDAARKMRNAEWSAELLEPSRHDGSQCDWRTRAGRFCSQLNHSDHGCPLVG